MSLTLYTLSSELEHSLEQLTERLNAGDEPSMDEVLEMLQLQDATTDKLKRYGFVTKNLNAETDALDAEIKRLTDRKKARINELERLKSAMMEAMKRTGIQKIDDPVMPIRLQNSPASLCLDVSAEALPDEYLKIKTEVDKAGITKALKAGAVIHGARLVQNQHIRIG